MKFSNEPCYNCGSTESANYNQPGTANGISLCDECCSENTEQWGQQGRDLEFEGKEEE